MSPSFQDHVRHNRVREDINNQAGVLVKPAKKLDATKWLPKHPRAKAKASLKLIGLMCSCIIAYGIMMPTWFFVYKHSFGAALAIFIGLIAVAIGMCVLSLERVTGRETPLLFWAGAMFGLTSIFALIIGFFVYFHYLAYYYRYEDMRVYTNVAASQEPNAFIDGSMLLFTEDTRIDPMRAVGFKSRWTGQVYCVAPIVDSSMSNANDIHYWAIGENCCNSRADFHCGDAKDSSTRSALIALEPEDVVRPFMSWAVQGANYPRYERAIKLQEATYYTRGAQKPKLVYWVNDPITMKDTFFKSAMEVAIQAGAIYLFIMVCLAWYLTFCFLPDMDQPMGKLMNKFSKRDHTKQPNDAGLFRPSASMSGDSSFGFQPPDQVAR